MLKIHVLNVGLGDSLVLETFRDTDSRSKKRNYLLVDCATIDGQIPTIDFLKKRNVSIIDSIVVSHYHYDHCRGFPALAEYLSAEKILVKKLILPGAAATGTPSVMFTATR